MTGSNVVIVESPAKAKTINKYLGDDFTVLASFGHVRDLPARDGSVRPDEDFAMEWELGDRSRRHIDEIAKAVKGAKRVYLATDPDREGEAIAWHLSELLKEKRLSDKVEVQRITFNEITKNAVQAALKAPRDVSRELVDAYLARRALDYLVGFTLSPVLWRKLPGSKSAGRVQSVALRLVCEREAEIEAFRPQEYWSIDVGFTTPAGAAFNASLTQLDGKKLDKFGLPNKDAADKAVVKIKAAASYTVSSVERRQVRRNPYAPFTTSTLQQEASRKLGFGATRTMRLAQKLYEGVDIGGETVGLITYMRTDGVTLSQEAIEASRRLIGEHWGEKYVPAAPRVYKTAAKNAQEAHEAIRPTDLFRRPEVVSAYLEKDELRLYELIWKRTLASQMESAVLDQVSVDLASTTKDVVLRASGSILVFDGFMRVYQEDKDDAADDDQDRRLPAMAERDALTRGPIEPAQHFTQPPPRYTEASLVKKLEELGIGRPSTYASILQVLQDREYVRLDKRRFEPSDRGRLVTAFLKNFFNRYVEYNFTADLENQLDEVSGGRIDWKTVLREFWRAFSGAVEGTKDLTITQVLTALDEELGQHFFPAGSGNGGVDPRVCPQCGKGRLGLKLGKNGAFIGCNNYPECRYTRPLAVANDENGQEQEGPRDLGDDPETGLPVTVRRGPYGVYVQLGPPRGHEEKQAEEKKAAEEEKAKSGKKPKKAKDDTPKPKRVSLPRGMAPADIELETALALLALPRVVGNHPETGQEIQAGIGRFGPYLKHGTMYKSLTPDDDVLTVGMNRAVDLLGEAAKKASTPAVALGNHPKTGKPVTTGSGRFGPYVKHGSLYASIPKGTDAATLTLAQGLELLAAKEAKDAAKKGKAPAEAEAPAEEKKAAPKAPTKAKAGTKTAAKASTTKKAAANTDKPKAPAKKRVQA
ncbi:type I DNA topoisomerase [Azospirillum sp. TSO22-1]|uniref:type I DNA topoisomerase n=1 Tax=Azospirillum sp. TSO22-1 TaxID=716789 RepID=UPI000D62190F|nr:type I DNA topoisomerase [Azospirillum sp. TSO22-1]PWC35466.1 DNA topoisomerase I [Azospirillum sp. TSO22-1]